VLITPITAYSRPDLRDPLAHLELGKDDVVRADAAQEPAVVVADNRYT
jgi:hypothetical protein